MTSLLTARRKHLAAAFRLHAHAKTVRLGTPAFARLICALWQSNPPLILRAARAGSFRYPRVRAAIFNSPIALDKPPQRLIAN
jgi:hypothetical protein